MLTKYILTIGSTEYEIPDECLQNWNEISFSLKRTDYSGVMRSFSTEFVFVGEIYDLLFAEFRDKGFKAAASVAVFTITNTHEWERQFEAPLDFSTIEIENGKLSINSLDNTLSALLKSKKSQKYEFPYSSFNSVPVNIERISFPNSVKYNMPNTLNSADVVDAFVDEDASSIVSTEYYEPVNESSGYSGEPINRFFMKVNKGFSPLATVSVSGTVRFWLCPDYHSTADPSKFGNVAELQLGYHDESDDNFHRTATLFNDNIRTKRINNVNRTMWVGGTTRKVYATLDALIADAETMSGGLYAGAFGIVGDYAYGSDGFWDLNMVYEYQGGGKWIAVLAPGFYYQDRDVSATATLQGLDTKQYPRLYLTNEMNMLDVTMTVTWNDPVRTTYAYNCISPIQLLSAIVEKISPGATASIASDSAGLLDKTYLIPAERLRKMSGVKIYSTFQQFADWMEAVFGYTYRVVDNEVQFLHRSDLFVGDVVKEIGEYTGFKFSIIDDIIYTEVDAGYSKKEYGEINGRLETNFTNYYETGYDLTDKKLQLISKYRADSYGIEFTLRKGESTSDTQDSSTDEDIFFVCAETDRSTVYEPDNNNAYSPANCIDRNKGYIAALGNGKEVTLTMTSSDGNNELTDIVIPAGTALFSAAEVEFTTEDMDMPSDLNALVQIEHGGFRYTGFISEATCRYGSLNGVEYKLIVKDISEI